DQLGHRATATTAGQVTTYRYDDAGELCWTATADSADTSDGCANPPTGATTYSYDAAGRLLTQYTDSNDNASFSYDAAGRPQTTTLVGGVTNTTQTRQYDPAGNLVATSDTGSDSLVTTYTWDVASPLPTLSSESYGGDAPFDLLYGAGQWADIANGGNTAGVGLDAQGN